jgi:A/G-specific adenine glycosylase
MDIGATLCKPRKPACEACPARPWCRYAADGSTEDRSPPPTGRSRAVRETAVPFTSTSRWLRGRIVERLSASQNGEWVEIQAPIGEHDQGAVDRAIEALARDGVIETDATDQADGHRPARLPT